LKPAFFFSLFSLFHFFSLLSLFLFYFIFIIRITHYKKMNEGLLSVKNASGRQVSLLNSNDEPQQQPTSPTSFSSPEEWQQDAQQSKRKYHCIEPGCNKSFTTR
jgi:hypothetical protein